MFGNVPLPPGTIVDDPRLGPLQDNGGFTPTHALLNGSPAIDSGSNPLALNFDQRLDQRESDAARRTCDQGDLHALPSGCQSKPRASTSSRS